MTPKVTVIMPSLNVVDYIDECITSITNQTLQEIEIICIDAGSTDGTYEKLNAYAALDSRIKLIHSDIKSYGYQVNIGLDLACGEYITIVETDDYIDIGMLNKMYLLANANKLDYIKSNYERYVLYKEKRIYIPQDCFPKNHDVSYNQILNEPKKIANLNCNDYSIWRTLYKREFLLSNNIKCLETPGAAYQDIGFCFKVIKYAKTAMYIPDYFYKYCAIREQSSCFNPRVIKYCYEEFYAINEHDLYNGDDYDHQGFYYKLYSYSLNELKRLLTIMHCELTNENFYQYYGWIRAKLLEGLEKNYIYLSKQLDLFINHLDQLIELFTIEYKKKSAFFDKIKNFSNCRLAYWGFGSDGRNLLVSSIQHDIFPDVIIDSYCTYANDTIKIIKFNEIKESLNDFIFIISSSKYYDNIKNNLLKNGIQESRIL